MLPVCLHENSSRLVSLWDIVNLFDVREFGRLQCLLECLTASAHATTATVVETSALAGICDAVKQFCEKYGYGTCRDMAAITADRMRRTAAESPGVVEAEARNIQNLLAREVHYQKFLWISKLGSECVDNDNLFGDAVTRAFPSSSRDIKESGNCIAAECGTAAVFHLMRAAEIALRALAADRGVQYPDAALSSKQVGDLLAALDGKMAEMRKADSKLWPSKDVKDAQIKFYHTAIAELRDFNEAWRKHMAHAHEGAFYDSDQAESVLKHVRSFMQALSGKISEGSSTPLYWTSA
jgi:hypothetical protein